jgi:hypothetical protein
LIALRFFQCTGDELAFVFGEGRVFGDRDGVRCRLRRLRRVSGCGGMRCGVGGRSESGFGEDDGEIGDVDFCGLGHHGGVADGVLQFANIAGPGVALEDEAARGG